MMIPSKTQMTVIPLSLLTKFLAIENDIVGGNRNAIISQTINNLFAPLPESDSGFPTCNESLTTDDDLPTLQQLASQRLADQSVQTCSTPDNAQQSLKRQDQQKGKRRKAKSNQSQKQQKKCKRVGQSKRNHNSDFESSESETEEFPERFNVGVRQPQLGSDNDSQMEELSNSDSPNSCSEDERDSERMEQSIFLY